MAPAKKKNEIAIPDTSAPQKPLLTKKEVCDLLQISERSIERMMSAQEIPKPVKLRSRSPRFRWADLKAWIDGGCQPIAVG